MATGGLDPQAPPFLSSPTEDIKARLTKDYSNLLTGDRTAIQNIVDLNIFLLNKCQIFKDTACDLADELNSLRAKTHELDRELSFMRQENILLKNQIALTEDATRTLFLRVEGLHEKNGENLMTYVASTLSRTGISCSYDDLDYARRIGKFKQGSTRPVLVKFVREYKRNLILYNRANLNRNSNSLIWINDDVSDHTRRQRKTVRDIATYAKSIGQTDLKIHGDGLIIDGGKYKHQDLDLLPPHLSIAIAKQPSNETDLYFQSEFSPLSNFFAASIDDGYGICYTSAEQFFQHKKALFHSYSQTANKILKNRDPYELKRLGNLIQTNQEWRQTEESVMTNILRSKFTQNPDLTQILLNTGTLHLHEASADHKWATGAELASKALQQGSWPGSDRMGFLLENIRAELRGEPIVDPTPPSPDSPSPLTPLEGDELSPMPDEVDDPALPAHPMAPATSTSPPLSSTSTITSAPPPLPATYATIASPNHSNTNSQQNIPPPSQSPTPSIPPLMQTDLHKPSTPKSLPPHHPLPPTDRKLPPGTSVTNQQTNTFFGARFNPRRRKSSQPFTSDRAPVRRSARISQSTPFPSSQP